jgi:hypothetical protein
MLMWSHPLDPWWSDAPDQKICGSPQQDPPYANRAQPCWMAVEGNGLDRTTKHRLTCSDANHWHELRFRTAVLGFIIQSPVVRGVPTATQTLFLKPERYCGALVGQFLCWMCEGPGVTPPSHVEDLGRAPLLATSRKRATSRLVGAGHAGGPAFVCTGAASSIEPTTQNAPSGTSARHLVRDERTSMFVAPGVSPNSSPSCFAITCGWITERRPSMRR